jgi:hypothetical protein
MTTLRWSVFGEQRSLLRTGVLVLLDSARPTPVPVCGLGVVFLLLLLGMEQVYKNVCKLTEGQVLGIQ